jgi:hypothetical protein
MKYRGVSYSIVRGNTPNVWRWSVMVGRPEMLRIGDAATEDQAELEVREVIDRAIELEQSLRFQVGPKQQMCRAWPRAISPPGF